MDLILTKQLIWQGLLVLSTRRKSRLKSTADPQRLWADTYAFIRPELQWPLKGTIVSIRIPDKSNTEQLSQAGTVACFCTRFLEHGHNRQVIQFEVCFIAWKRYHFIIGYNITFNILLLHTFSFVFSLAKLISCNHSLKNKS